MYIAKFDRNGVKWSVTILEKQWSETMLTNEINIISSKKFWLYANASRWTNKEICKHLFKQHELEIING